VTGVGILVAGFEPFGKNEVNPSQLIAEELDGVVLPVSYARATGELQRALDARDPEIVIAFGLADDRVAITPERFAHNLVEADTTDNDDASGSGAEIDAAGPIAYRSTLPVDEIVAALRAEDIPAQVSRDAGGYLCNHVFYSLMHTLKPGRSGGFVHVPPLDVLPRDRFLRAGAVIVATCERHRSGT
jgi:pyroglutamyl-peptidase